MSLTAFSADDAEPAGEPATEPSVTQRLFPAHRVLVEKLAQQFGPHLASLSMDELLALQTLVVEELTQRDDNQCLATVQHGDTRLTAGDRARVIEENHRRYYNLQCRMAYLLEGWFETVDARHADLAHRGKQPFKNAHDFIARLLGIGRKETDRRIRIATANPTRPTASKMRAVKIQRAMAEGTIDPESANVIVDRLRSIRAAAKRSGATDDQVDRLVAVKEGELLAKALHAGPDEVRKFADRIKRSTNRTFTKPGTRLTPKQRQYEEGIRFISALGENHVRLDWVLTKWQYRNVLERLQRTINNLRTQTSKLGFDTPAGSGAERITPADQEYEMPMLYDHRTAAQRWSDFLLDILETGLLLTELPDHVETPPDPHDEETAPSGIVIPGLGKLVNVVPSVTVAVQYSDLAGTYLDFTDDNATVQTEIAALINGRKPIPELYDFDEMGLDWARLRYMSCEAGIIPVVLNSKGEPLDVGRKQRAFPSSIRRGVILRDGGCAYPGCHMPHLYSEVHHIEHWQNGGSTSLENAVMLCRFHHMIIHQTDVLVRLSDDQFPEFLLNPNTPEAAWVRNMMHRG